VKGGETLSSIALKHGCTVKQIYAENGGERKLSTLRVGQVLYLPYTPEQLDEIERRKELRLKQAAEARKAAVERARATADSARERAMNARAATHTVESGDTLSRIARKYGTTVAELQQANGGAGKLKTLRLGQKIVLPGAEPVEADSVSDAAAALSELKAEQSRAVQKPAKAAPAKPKAVKIGQPESYKVQPGDTIWSITHRFGMSEAEFKKLNPSVSSSSLRVGASIKIIRKK
jgi:membrane-bound lytic murein transglycosylase D